MARKKASQTEIDQRWLDEHGSLQWAGGVIVKTPEGYLFEYAGRTMTLPPKTSLTALKRAASRSADEIARINIWNQSAVRAA